MFEKEAEEYATENWEYYEEGQNDSKALKQAYLAGAEFGYNKANEWHFVSKEGFPNKDDIYLIIRSDGLHLGDYCCGETEILIVKVGAIIQVKKKYKTIVLSLGKKLYFQRRVNK